MRSTICFSIILASVTFSPAVAQSNLPTKKNNATPAQTAPSADAQRKSDLQAVRAALEAYARKNGGNFRVAGSGYKGQGIGGVTTDGSPTVVQKLVAEGFLKGRTIGDPVKGQVYLLYLCDNDRKFSLSARLDKPTEKDVEGAKTTCNALGVNGTVDLYKMNYAIHN